MTTAKISERKKQIVEILKKELLSYPIIGLVKIDNIDARVVQQMRKDLREEAKIIMAKNTLMKIAISELKKKIPGIEKLSKYVVGSCAFLLTKTNPYKLASFMDKNKVPAPAKAGQIAPNDVVIRPMNTGIPPGPVIAELQSLGLKTRIEGGQIRIAEEATITKEGERVNRTVALLLRRLNINPFQTGLSFVVAFESGDLIPGNELILDYDTYEQRIRWAHNSALNLAVNAGIVTRQSLPLILSSAHQFALNLSINAVFPTKESVKMILFKAAQQVQSLAMQILDKNPDALSNNAKESLKEKQKAIIVTSEESKSTAESNNGENKKQEEEEEEEDLGLASLFG
ncbi:MAG: 50S ribosomal protein L10 [Candidatus Heimdallarchaeaceae archaeon]